MHWAPGSYSLLPPLPPPQALFGIMLASPPGAFLPACFEEPCSFVGLVTTGSSGEFSPALRLY